MGEIGALISNLHGFARVTYDNIPFEWFGIKLYAKGYVSKYSSDTPLALPLTPKTKYKAKHF